MGRAGAGIRGVFRSKVVGHSLRLDGAEEAFPPKPRGAIRIPDVTSPLASGTPYERGVAHLKRSEYAQAVAAFTEAIGLEPEAPNAYVGRALAHRSLGDEAAALQDEQAARNLGGPERSTWDRIV